MNKFFIPALFASLVSNLPGACVTIWEDDFPRYNEKKKVIEVLAYRLCIDEPLPSKKQLMDYQILAFQEKNR